MKDDLTTKVQLENGSPAFAKPVLPAVPSSVVYNEDCVEALKRFPDNYFDLAIVDPPYGIERFKKCSEADVSGATTTKSRRIAERFQRMETVNNDKPSDEYWEQLFRVSKNQIIWGANNFELPPSEYFLCWNKQQAMPNFATLEYAWVSMGLKKPAKLFTYSIHKHNQVDKVHPTQKPIPLYDWILQNYANEGDLILDTHLGSGSSRIAAHKGGFNFIGYEISKDYYEAQEKRFKDFVSQLRLF
jgi:site-specific DNA-methyltransferase (adenine-specific)